jgi:DNA topoisomerase-2
MAANITKKPISEFLDTDYLNYAKYIVEHRAIPSVIDGFKPTARKVIYVANRVWNGKGNGKPIKVFQLGGKVSSEAFYHHGEAGLNGTIITMAQSFKNNMPLLQKDGQFGVLRNPAPGAPRYIGVSLHKNFAALYTDFELLNPQFEEGYEIEPEYFLPVIPTVLLNGSSGIAVGFATSILNRHPLDLINACIKCLNDEEIPNLLPWNPEFSGTVVKDPYELRRYIFRGKYEVKNTTDVLVTELPPSMTFEKYETYLNKLVEEKKFIYDYDNNSKKGQISYLVKFRREELAALQKKGDLLKALKLEESDTDNLTTLDEFGKVKVFDKTSDLVKYFVNFRLSFYQKRKDYLINKIEHEILVLTNKARFIKFIIEGKIKINNIPKAQIVEQLTTHKFDKINSSYDYLLAMPIHSLTKEKYEELLKQLEEKKVELEDTKKLIPKKMYQLDLTDLKKEVEKDFNKI